MENGLAPVSPPSVLSQCGGGGGGGVAIWLWFSSRRNLVGAGFFFKLKCVSKLMISWKACKCLIPAPWVLWPQEKIDAGLIAPRSAAPSWWDPGTDRVNFQSNPKVCIPLGIVVMVISYHRSYLFLDLYYSTIISSFFFGRSWLCKVSNG